MQSLIFSKESLELLDVENFVEDICERYNIHNTFQGNIIIAISEMIDLLKSIGAKGEIRFVHEKDFFKYDFSIKSINENLASLFSIEPNNFSLETNYEKGIFAIMALCDDFIIDEANTTISILFKNETETDLSSHRKDFLQNYLGKTFESYQKNEA